MAKIIIDARESGTSTGRYVDKLIEYLAKLDSSLDFIILTKAHRVNFVRKVAPKFTVIESNFKEFTFAEQLGLLKQIKALEPDLVHFTMTQQPALYRGKVVTTIADLTTARFGNPSKNPVIFWFKQQVYKWLIKHAARKSDKVITISQFVKDDVAQYTKIKSDKITVTYLAADKTPGHSEPVTGLKDKDFLLYVGRPQPHKNLRRLIDAHQELRWKYPELLLVLAGKTDDNYRLLQKYAAKKKAGDVVFTDFVSDAQLKWLYEQAKVYVFPSLSEGFGLPGLEAMQYGLPIVSSRATCLPEIYKDAALYFDPNSTKDLVDKVSLVLDDKQLSKELSAKGQKLAASYSWERMAKQTLEVYEKILDK